MPESPYWEGWIRGFAFAEQHLSDLRVKNSNKEVACVLSSVLTELSNIKETTIKMRVDRKMSAP